MKPVCVVTGAARGQGFAAAKKLGERYKIVLSDLREDALERPIEELKAAGVDVVGKACDVSDKTQVIELMEFAAEQGDVMAIVNAAGVAPAQAPWNVIIDVDAIGCLYVDDAGVEVMSDGGVIINFSSSSPYLVGDRAKPIQVFKKVFESDEALREGLYESLAPIPEDKRGGMSYPLAKGFVQWYTERLALLVGDRGIRVISIAPGVIDTEMAKDPTSEHLASITAFKRKGTPEEVANVIDFLCSDGASYLTGQDIQIDGGEVAALHRDAEDKEE